MFGLRERNNKKQRDFIPGENLYRLNTFFKKPKQQIL